MGYFYGTSQTIMDVHWAHVLALGAIVGLAIFAMVSMRRRGGVRKGK